MIKLFSNNNGKQYLRHHDHHHHHHHDHHHHHHPHYHHHHHTIIIIILIMIIIITTTIIIITIIPSSSPSSSLSSSSSSSSSSSVTTIITIALPSNVGDRVLPTSSVLGCWSSRSCPFPTQLCAKTVHQFNLTVSHEPLLPASFSVQIRCSKLFLLIMWTIKVAFCFFYSINQRPCWPRFFNYFSVFFGVHGILNILLQNQTSAAYIFFCIGLFVVRALHPYTRRGSMNKILWTLCLMATDMFFFKFIHTVLIP